MNELKKKKNYFVLSPTVSFLIQTALEAFNKSRHFKFLSEMNIKTN